MYDKGRASEQRLKEVAHHEMTLISNVGPKGRQGTGPSNQLVEPRGRGAARAVSAPAQRMLTVHAEPFGHFQLLGEYLLSTCKCDKLRNEAGLHHHS